MKHLAITLGDPAGIGPEITVKALLKAQIRPNMNFVILGSGNVFTTAVDKFSKPGEFPAFECLDTNSIPEKFAPGTNYLIDIGPLNMDTFKPGTVRAEYGKTAVKSIETAAALALAGKVDAIVTAPIHKKAIELAGSTFQGHTDMLQHLTGAASCTMMLACDKIKVALVTTHISLASVPAAITTGQVQRCIEHAAQAAVLMGIPSPRIGVCALNPHAGEQGRFGDEEIMHITPAIELCRKQFGPGIEISDALPPDTAFYAAYHGHYDIMVAMYHDQGLIPMKMVGFDTGVNITLGLPIVRTSPDHGTAFNIAWQSTADTTSMEAAIKTAIEFTRGKQ